MGSVLLRKLAGAAMLAAVAAGAQAPRADLSRVEALIVEQTNAFRRGQGLAPVHPEGRLTASARYFADYMAHHGRFAHDADGREPGARASHHGYEYCLVAENIAYQQSSADFGTAELTTRNVEGWKASPGHRRNMLSPHATDTGVAVARGTNGRYYAVQMFGRPKSASIEFRITNSAGDAVRYRLGGRDYTLSAGDARIHTQCTPEELVLASARDPAHAKAMPRNGDRFIAVREPGGLALRASSR